MQGTIDFHDSSYQGAGDGGQITSWMACYRCRIKNMFERRTIKRILLLMMCVFACGFVYLGYFCTDGVCALTGGSVTQSHQSGLDAYLDNQLLRSSFESRVLLRDYDDFDVEGSGDVIVFLHIQKTGGTVFGRHLVKNIDLKTPCTCYKHKKKCDCENSQNHLWLFSRFSSGWRCGLHADWTELKNCVAEYIDNLEHPNPRRRYLYITILRDPYYRYLSEWRHSSRGATWLEARLKCNGRQATLEEVPFCFSGGHQLPRENWSGVELDEFLNCPYNLANNRQTRMLANLSLVGCYNHSKLTPEERDRRMLESAKRNLQDMAFFGLAEFQTDTQILFENTFHLNFIEDFVQRNSTHATEVEVTEAQYNKIVEVNKLDIELYMFAKDLFIQRVEKLKASGGYRQRTSSNINRVIDNHEEGDENYDSEEIENEGPRHRHIRWR